MVSKRKFNKIKEKDPESRIGQRTWKQQQYRNRLYKILKKGRKKGDKNVINDFEEKKQTWEYISSEYGTGKKGAMKMIDGGYGEFIVDNLDKFSGLDKDIAMKMVDKGYGDLIVKVFDKFLEFGLDKEFAMKVMMYYKGSHHNFKHSYPSHGDSTYNECTGIKLCELIMENANKISGLDKEFMDEYLKFYEKYQYGTTGYAGSYIHNSIRYNSFKLLINNIGFIKGIRSDKPELFVDLINFRSDENLKLSDKNWIKDDIDSEWILGKCSYVVKNLDIKIPSIVWKSLGFYELVDCFADSNFDGVKFFSRLEGLSKDNMLEIYSDSFQKPGFGKLFDYLINDNEYGITHDDLLNKWGYFSEYNMAHILESLPKEEALKFFERILIYADGPYIDDTLKRFANYNRSELGITPKDLSGIYDIYKSVIESRNRRWGRDREMKKNLKSFEDFFPNILRKL